MEVNLSRMYCLYRFITITFRNTVFVVITNFTLTVWLCHGGNNNKSQQQPVDIECGIWLAPSTITGAGVGMFAGKEYETGDELLPSGDSVLAIVDLVQHRSGNPEYDASIPFLWDEYVWSHKLFPGYDGRISVSASSPGFGSAANSFLSLYNVEEWFSTKDSTGLHRRKDPGVGGFSLYHNRKSTAKSDIVRGQELFVSYGETWFETREHFGPVPLTNDLDTAQELVSAFKILRKKIGKDFSNLVWDEFVRSTKYVKSRVIGAFHHSDSNEIEILTNNNQTLFELRVQQSIRSLEWLREHGTCGDHIIVGTSTIPQAGRGAFATRTLPKGTIVAQLPMIHLPDRAILEMYNFVNIENRDGVSYIPHKGAGRMGYQLLMNYCYGHRQSTMVLCPYGPLVNYVNHNQTRVNVRLRWGRSESGNHMPEILNFPPSMFAKDKTSKLAMEFVATVDIAEGDEIFLDYGDEWEEAWQEHVRQWKPVDGANRYMASYDNNHLDDTIRLPTIFEQLGQKAPPFKPNLDLHCDRSFEDIQAEEWKRRMAEGTMEDWLVSHSVDFLPCTILRVSQSNDGYNLYTVHAVKKNEDEEPSKKDNPPEHLILKSLPRSALRFFDMPYTDDTFLPNAFRHDIRIHDDIFPQKWKNKETSVDWEWKYVQEDRHVVSEPEANSDTDVDSDSGYDINLDNDTKLPTIFEQMDHLAEPFPSNVYLRCDHTLDADDWQNHMSEGTMDHFLENHIGDFWVCNILRSSQSDEGYYLYTVHAYYTSADDEESEHVILKDLPRAALWFFDKSDHDDTL